MPAPITPAAFPDRQAALDRLPATATLEQMSEELALLAALRRGSEAADAGRVVPHAEAERRSEAWTSK